jgi:hypothetical protein
VGGRTVTPIPTTHGLRVAVTHEVHVDCTKDKEFQRACLFALQRHLKGDDGDLDKEDKEANEEVRRTGRGRGRVLSAYAVPAANDRHAHINKIWIITDGLGTPEATTTVLYPHEY